jgi:DHA1 family tetracycline resistance protein-like MFS transporter
MSIDAKPLPVSRHAVTFVLITVFLDMVGIGLIIPVLPALIGDVGHVDIAQASIIGGWMYLAFSAAQFAFGPLMGNLSDRFGRRPLLLLAIAGLGIDYVLQALAPNVGWLYVGRAVAGVCGASWVIANAYIADITAPEERAKYFGILGAAFGVGFVVGPAIGGLLGSFGPRVPFWVAAAISGLNLVYGLFVLPETLPPEKRRRFEWRRSNPFGVFKVFATYPKVLPLCGVMGGYFFFGAIYPAIWPFWGIAKFGWSEAMVGATLAVFGIVMALFQGLLTGPAAARFGEARVVMFGLFCAVVAAVGYGLASGLVMVAILLVIHGPEGFISPMVTAEMTKAVPDNAQGELQGGLSAITTLTMLAGTLFFTQVFGHFMAEGRTWQSPDIGFFIAGAGLAVTMAAYWIVERKAPKAA